MPGEVVLQPPPRIRFAGPLSMAASNQAYLAPRSFGAHTHATYMTFIQNRTRSPGVRSARVSA